MKIFCIGYNKTGTTSLTKLFKDEGYKVAPQGQFELELKKYVDNKNEKNDILDIINKHYNNYYHADFYQIICDLIKKYPDQSAFFKRIIFLIKEQYNDYEFFQDIPFALPNLYKDLYLNFPSDKFILSVRNTSIEWYNSLIQFYASFWGMENLNNVRTTHPDIYEIMTQFWGGTPEKPYHRQKLINTYEKHNSDIRDFFHAKDNFIEINLAVPNDFIRLQEFLGVKFKSTEFPHENKTMKNNQFPGIKGMI
jgi:hypothetical protein